MTTAVLTVASILGVLIWLAGLVGVVFWKKHLEGSAETVNAAWIPLTAYLIVSAVVMVIAGVVHHYHTYSAIHGVDVQVESLKALDKYRTLPLRTSTVPQGLLATQGTAPDPAESTFANFDSLTSDE